MFKKSTIAILLFGILSGCGGGGGGGGSDDNHKPTVKTVEINLPSKINLKEPKNSNAEPSLVSLKLSAAATKDIIILATTTAGTATDNGQWANYQALNKAEYTIKKGEKSANIPLSVFDNNKYEGDKTLYIKIELKNKEDKVKIGNDESIITIEDAQTIPTILVDDIKATSTVIEGATYSLNVSLSNYTESDVTIPLAFTGLASQSDYRTNLVDGELVIPSGSLDATLTVDVIADMQLEGSESIVIKANKANGATLSESFQTTLFIPGDFQLNDTGYRQFFDGYTYDNDTPSSKLYPDQDATHGNDVTGDLSPQDGDGAFSFQKLDGNGNALPYNATEFSCVLDKRTGVYYEAKGEALTPILDSDIDNKLDIYKDELRADPTTPFPYQVRVDNWRSSGYLYNWFDDNRKTNGGYEGDDKAGVFVNSKYSVGEECSYPLNSKYGKHCNTQDYIDVMNRKAVCGFTDWKIGTPAQVRGWVNYNRKIDSSATEFFANTKNTNAGAATHLWTSATAADKKGSAWCVNVDTNQIELCLKNEPNGILAVTTGGNK